MAKSRLNQVIFWQKKSYDLNHTDLSSAGYFLCKKSITYTVRKFPTHSSVCACLQ